MFRGSSNRTQFAVVCKSCRMYVSAGIKDFPFQSILVTCPSCHEERRYIPSEVSLGKPDLQERNPA
jgi:RNase P subunit RPR2